MPYEKRGSRLTRPWRRVRRWMLTTPDSQIALAMIGLGCLALVVAGVLYYAWQQWG